MEKQIWKKWWLWIIILAFLIAIIWISFELPIGVIRISQEGPVIQDQMKWEIKDTEIRDSVSGINQPESEFLLSTVEIVNISDNLKEIKINFEDNVRLIDSENRYFEVFSWSKDPNIQIEKESGKIVDSVYRKDFISRNLRLQPDIPKIIYIGAEIASNSNWKYLELKYEK